MFRSIFFFIFDKIIIIFQKMSINQQQKFEKPSKSKIDKRPQQWFTVVG